MTKQPKKTYDIFEALERFAKPDIKQRLIELKSFANEYKTEDENLHNEYITLAFASSDYLVEQLMAGNLSARDYTEGTGHSHPKVLIDSKRWKGVDIDPRTGSICNEHGPVFPTVEIWDPAEEGESEGRSEEGLQNSNSESKFRFHIHADGERVIFDFGVDLQGTPNKLFRCLYAIHSSELGRSVAPQLFRAVSNVEISEKLKILEETVPPTVKRTREELSRKFADAGVPCGSEDIIETQRTAGYRLNPNLQQVAFHQLKPKEP